ncbi:GNAT family N-acetyltransferase [Acidobacteriota bacterium]
MLYPLEIKRFEIGQEQEVSNICQRCIDEINAKDSTEKQVKNLLNAFTPRGILSHASQSQLYVAINAQGQICGTGTLAGNRVKGVFVDVKFIGKGIGRKIMAFLENEARDQGEEFIFLSSSKFAVKFYEKIGYIRIKHVNSRVGHMTKMEKKI